MFVKLTLECWLQPYGDRDGRRHQASPSRGGVSGHRMLQDDSSNGLKGYIAAGEERYRLARVAYLAGDAGRDPRRGEPAGTPARAATRSSVELLPLIRQPIGRTLLGNHAGVLPHIMVRIGCAAAGYGQSRREDRAEQTDRAVDGPTMQWHAQTPAAQQFTGRRTPGRVATASSGHEAGYGRFGDQLMPFPTPVAVGKAAVRHARHRLAAPQRLGSASGLHRPTTAPPAPQSPAASTASGCS